MEIMYPIAIIVLLIVGVILLFVKPNKKVYTDGKKVANTQYIKETEYYKTKVKKYNIISNIIKGLIFLCILITSILIARPVTIQTKSEDKYNRDIIMGLDVSTSECEVNLELIEKFKKIIPEINGDRIGIVIYNTAPIVYCPLTNDYDYINECFDTIKEQLEIVIENDGYAPGMYEKDGKEVPTIWIGGIGANAETRGSSLVGDGLARNSIFFSKFKRR